MRTSSSHFTLLGILLLLILPTALARHPDVRLPGGPIVNVPDTTEGTDDVIDRVTGSAWWLVRETRAFLKAVRDEVHDCLDPHGPGC